MDLGLEGKTVIVTGSASNIGRSIALAFGKEKSNVVLADIDADGAGSVAKEVEAAGGQALVVKTDVTDPAQVEAMVKAAQNKFKTIDVLVNDAAIWITKPFIKTTIEEWKKQIDINYLGTVICSKAVLPAMMEQNSGRIVSIGSDAGRIGENKQTVYSGTKGAVLAFTKALATEVGRYGVTVNAVCPGATPGAGEGKRGAWKGVDIPDEIVQKMAKLYPMGRIGKPEDVANAVVFLASAKAPFITGQILSASGGFSRAG